MNIGRFFEFFSGGGMARAGLGGQWRCAFANDFDPMKAATYRANWGDDHLTVCDVNEVTTAMLPGYADLVWASFPCQDLSLAGNTLGLGTEQRQTRSGAFWAFWRLIPALRHQGRAPAIILLENVYGILTANRGGDFAIIAETIAREGYRLGALCLDAAAFVPQSRLRVFIVAVRDDFVVPPHLVIAEPDEKLHPKAMSSTVSRLAERDRAAWLWLTIPLPTTRSTTLNDIVERSPDGVEWHSEEQTNQLIAMMSDRNRAKLSVMQSKGGSVHGTIYRRTRRDIDGTKIMRAELRDDQIAGCLRTPSGGSSRQFLIEVTGARVRTRLISGREAARLMGLPDSYKLPKRYNDAYHVAGDGLVVPVVRHLAANLMEPILLANPATIAATAA